MKRRARLWFVVLPAALVAASSCVVDALDVSTKGCPCPAPLFCDLAANRCVTELDAAAGDGSSGSCPAGFGDCDNNPANGCETDLATTVGHCGRCGNVCAGRASAFPLCEKSRCTIGCNVGTGNCDGNDENGCETDVTTSTVNCGVCVHDCLGGSCTKGLCEAQRLASNLDAPGGIALDATHVYWTTSTAVQRIPKGGGAVQNVVMGLDASQAEPAIVVEGNLVYFIDNGKVLTCPTTGCATPTLFGTLGGGTDAPLTLALDITDVYVSNGATFNAHLWRSPKDGGGGGGADAGFVQVHSSGMGFTLVATDERVYWTRLSGAVAAWDKATKTGVVNALGDSGSGPGFYGSLGLAASTDRVYWSVYNTSDLNGVGHVFRCPAATCSSTSAEIFARDLFTPHGLVMDAKFVYFTAEGSSGNQFTDGKVLRCSHDGCGSSGPATLATDHDPTSLALDQTHVYWISFGDRAIVRVAK